MPRFWGPLSCHSSSAITSSFSMIMHCPMSQGSAHNSWKLKMSQLFHSLYTHQTCHPLSMFGMLWIDVYDSLFHYPPIFSNFTQSLKRSGTTFHNQQPVQLCDGDVTLHKANGSHTRYWLVFWATPLSFLRCLWPTDAYLYSQSCEINRLGLIHLFPLTDFLMWTVTQ